MKKFIAILVFAAGTFLQASAQSFLNDLQQKKQGEGTVTVKQSADIDNLVNNAKLKASSQAQAAQNQQTAKQASEPQHRQQHEKTIVKPSNKTATNIHTEQIHHAASSQESNRKERANGDSLTQKRQQQQEHKAERERKTEQNEKHTAKSATETEVPERPVVDTSKKMMRNSYKVTGYRIQAYSGGNSRADREKANKIGDAIKMKFPDQPVYVHFYSPRWICRVGNFRSYSEAAKLLRSIKAMGYTQACIVKGKINVAY